MARAEAADSNVPRYRQLTARLRAAIASGEYPVGSLLPTEMEISRHFGVSRHTVRDALRILNSAGLIQRRRRVGTIVTARTTPKQFVQPLPGFDEVLQYGRDVRLVIASYDTRFACPLARKLGLKAKDWMRIEGRRGPEGRLIGLTTVLIRRDCVPPRSKLEKLATSLGELIEKSANLVIARIDQEISAMTVDSDTARALKMKTGAPALRARRLYYENRGDLLLATESIHPADRFNYKLTFARGSDDG
ncbi:MAG TPA: GntR family transcriptional regulator [Alphaproteobacteria bacterium]|nr:GntR family transcriptional regulator [Alphaproteobacteria bacterium]